MTLLKWLLTGLLAAVVLLPVLLFVAALEHSPRVTADRNLNQDNVARIKEVLRDADPRWLRVGDRRTLNLVEADLNLILNYGINEFLPGAVLVSLDTDTARVQLSVDASRLLAGRYLNTAFLVRQQDDGYQIADWQLGSLVLPDRFSDLVLRLARRLLANYAPYHAVLAALEDVQIQPGRLQVRYHWHQDLKDQVQSAGRQWLLSARDQERLRFYHERIYQLSQQLPRRQSLTALLAALFASAAERSDSAVNAVAENRTLLLALALHLARIDVKPLLATPTQPLSYSWLMRSTLAGREDLAQHFAVSAAIQAAAGSDIASAAGLFKELRDSQGGSGFSFADLAADRAGTRFAGLALASATALALQRSAAALTDEAAFMPDVDHLPEGLQQLEFDRRYANMDNADYRALMTEIERRIESCPLYVQH